MVFANEHGDAARAKIFGLLREAARQRCGTAWAMAIGRELVAANLVPVALNQGFAALCAQGAATLHVVDVAGVDVVQALRTGNGAGTHQGLQRGGGNVRHPVIRVECREMQGHIRA